MAFATMGTTLGAMVMAPVLGFLITTRGWRETWILMGIMVITVMAPLTLLFVRRQPEDMGLQPDGGPSRNEMVDEGPGSERKGEPDEVSWTLKEAMHTRTLWMIVVAMNLVGLSATLIVIHLVPFLTLQQGMSAQAASFVVSLRLAASSISRLVWGFAVDRFHIKHCLAVAFLSRAIHPLALILLPYPLNVTVLDVPVNFGTRLRVAIFDRSRGGHIPSPTTCATTWVVRTALPRSGHSGSALVMRSCPG